MSTTAGEHRGLGEDPPGFQHDVLDAVGAQQRREPVDDLRDAPQVRLLLHLRGDAQAGGDGQVGQRAGAAFGDPAGSQSAAQVQGPDADPGVAQAL
ncbi:MAG: hypothetical protein AUG49_20275 [Catenulispora sp. 13_1_20CM_3_70_7]|nr:MAG: hypothetical protein AUG49_20275 [Catenulispora sp. 13_1_20CM_3_70_7]